MFASKDKWRTQTHANPGGSPDMKIRAVNNVNIFTFFFLMLDAVLFCFVLVLSLLYFRIFLYGQTEHTLCHFSVMSFLVIPLCLSRVSIWDSICFCTFARPCSLTSDPISALAIKSHCRDLCPTTKPFLQHQP